MAPKHLPYDREISKAVEEMRTMKMHWLSADHILTAHGLEFYNQYFMAYNGAANLPYHNDYHSYCMVLNCFEGAWHERIFGSQLRSLLVAALFHDFNHTGGKHPDGINIEMAIEGLRSAQMYVQKLTGGRPMVGDWYAKLTPQEFNDAVDAISITKYPYEKAPDTIIQKIIRDADLMQVYEQYERRLLKQFRGLREEVEKSRGPFTTEEWAHGYADFALKSEWHTNWAKRKAILLNHTACVENLKQLLLGYK